LNLPDEIAEQRNEYHSFANACIDERLVNAIEKKLSGHSELIEKLRLLTSQIKQPLVNSDCDYSQLEENVSMLVFNNKKVKMFQFKSKIYNMSRLFENEIS